MLPTVVTKESEVRIEGDQVLEIDRISKRFGDIVALHDLSFNVREGEVFGFVGSNGAGKTTTMRIVMGVLVDVLSEVLRRQAEAGLPVVFSSHQLDLVEQLSDRVGISAHGQMVACGTVEELRRTDTERLWVDVPGAAPGWTDELSGVKVVQKAIMGVIVAIVLFISLQIYGIQVAQGVAEEKESRIVEILLATVRPSQLLAGKVVGLAVVLTLATIGAAIWLASRIYANSVLRTGARIRSGEALHSR